MTDLIGPGDAGAARTLTTTGDVSNPAAGDTFFQDCVGGVPGTGTPIVSKWLNRLMQQVRRVISNTGIAQNNSDDDMLGQAIQSGNLNWAGTFGGSANALTATLSPAPAALTPGLEIVGIVGAANTSATSLTVPQASSTPVPVVSAFGLALAGGELIPGRVATLRYDGVFWQLGGQTGRQRLTANATYNVNASTGNDVTGNGSSAAPWATLQHAANYIQANIDTAGFNVIVLATGAFTTGVTLLAGWTGGGTVTFAFASGSSVSVLLNSCFTIAGPGILFGITTVSGTPLTLSATGTGVGQGVGVYAASFAQVTVSNVNFGACAGTAMYSQNAAIYVAGGITISGGGQYCLETLFKGLIQFSATQTLTISGTPAFSGAFASAVDGSLIVCQASVVTISGSATGKRYVSNDVSLIDTGGGGSTFFPGGTSGTAANSFNYQ